MSTGDERKVIAPKKRCIGEVMLLHTATLQDLLHARNRSLLRILYERNELLHGRLALEGKTSDFPQLDFLTSPGPPLPTSESPNDVEALLRGLRLPAWGRLSIDRSHADVGTQTEDHSEDPDMTLADIQPEIKVTEAEAGRKKRIRLE